MVAPSVLPVFHAAFRVSGGLAVYGIGFQPGRLGRLLRGGGRQNNGGLQCRAGFLSSADGGGESRRAGECEWRPAVFHLCGIDTPSQERLAHVAGVRPLHR